MTEGGECQEERHREYNHHIHLAHSISKEKIKVKTHLQLFVLFLFVSILTNACAAEQSEVGPGVIPNTLQTIEAAAEDVIDFAPSGNWDKISADVTDIENAWNSYQPQASKDGASQEMQDAMSSALSELQTALSAKNSEATMQASNNVSAAIVELFALYHPKVPVDIGRLDVLERQVILDVAAKDYTAATTSLAKTKSVWEKVKPSVLENDGKNVAADFEASLTTQESALNDKDEVTLKSEANNGLEIVDQMEQLY